jgi:SP family facilitated glucose transporter-like MFS transporter 1
VIFFSTNIFEQSGLKDDSATFATMGMGAINVLMTLISLVLVERAGRKTLLLIGFGGMAIDTLFLTIVLNFTVSPTATARTTLILEFQKTEPKLSYLCIILIFVYIVMFASGPGSIPWFLVAEMFNQSARPTAASLAVCTNWTANFLVGLAFLPIAVSLSRKSPSG